MKICINKRRPNVRWVVTDKEAEQLQSAPETRRKYRFEDVEGLEGAPALETPNAPHGVEKKEARTEENTPEEQPKKKSGKQKTNTETGL